MKPTQEEDGEGRSLMSVLLVVLLMLLYSLVGLMTELGTLFFKSHTHCLVVST